MQHIFVIDKKSKVNVCAYQFSLVPLKNLTLFKDSCNFKESGWKLYIQLWMKSIVVAFNFSYFKAVRRVVPTFHQFTILIQVFSILIQNSFMTETSNFVIFILLLWTCFLSIMVPIAMSFTRIKKIGGLLLSHTYQIHCIGCI